MKKETTHSLYNPECIQEIKQIVTRARQTAYAAINSAMVEAYWQLGKRIVEEEQQGRERAGYGKQLVKMLSEELTAEFGKGFSVPSLYNYRLFYLTFPRIFSTPWRILTWSHYKRLLTVTKEEARTWYLKEAAEQMWSYRTLGEGDSPTIGIVLCSETDEDLARYSVLHDSDRLFASKYMPTESELRQEIERQKEFFRLQHHYPEREG